MTAGSDAHGLPAVVPDPTPPRPAGERTCTPRTECYDLAVRRRAFGRALRAGPGLASAPVGDYLTARANAHVTDRTQELEQQLMSTR